MQRSVYNLQRIREGNPKRISAGSFNIVRESERHCCHAPGCTKPCFHHAHIWWWFKWYWSWSTKIKQAEKFRWLFISSSFAGLIFIQIIALRGELGRLSISPTGFQIWWQWPRHSRCRRRRRPIRVEVEIPVTGDATSVVIRLESDTCHRHRA